MAVENYQRSGAESNSGVGRDFEETARLYFESSGIRLNRGFSVPVGLGTKSKPHKFDFGSENPPILIECKSHKWTAGDNVPSAKITVWNESMYLFHLAPAKFRKILFVLRDYSERRGETLAEYYARSCGHLVPDGVEIIEYDEESGTAREVVPKD